MFWPLKDQNIKKFRWSENNIYDVAYQQSNIYRCDDSQIFWGFNKYLMTSHDVESDVLKDTLSNNETKSNNGTEKKIPNYFGSFEYYVK